MIENKSSKNDIKGESENRASVLSLKYMIENSLIKQQHNNYLSLKSLPKIKEKERNSQEDFNFMKSDEEDNIDDPENDSSFSDNHNSFLVYEKDKNDKRINDKEK